MSSFFCFKVGVACCVMWHVLFNYDSTPDFELMNGVDPCTLRVNIIQLDSLIDFLSLAKNCSILKLTVRELAF